MDTRIYELNKNSCNVELCKQIDALLSSLKFKDNSIKSLFVYLIYGKTDKKEVAIYQNDKIAITEAADIDLTVFRAGLSSILNEFYASSTENIKVIVSINYTHEEFSKKFLRVSKAVGAQEDMPALNVLPVEPKYSFEQMILKDSVRDEIQKIIVMIKNLDKIYNEWGFSKIDPIPRCIVNFFGSAGTGKTMAAHVVAKELGQKILPLNYSDIESKYVGDAPKNLVSAFKIAETEKCVLFFDEADSFLGRRITNVSSSSDQAVNSLRSQMLILLESFNGVVIFATNLHENYDSAFESRILRHIEFVLPDKEERALIIKKMIPENAPVLPEVFEDEFVASLAETTDGFAPREIKNAVLNVLVAAIHKNNAEITKELFTETFKAEKGKFDLIQRNNPELHKKKLGRSIKENLESGNYSVQKLKQGKNWRKSRKNRKQSNGGN